MTDRKQFSRQADAKTRRGKDGHGEGETWRTGDKERERQRPSRVVVLVPSAELSRFENSQNVEVNLAVRGPFKLLQERFDLNL